MSIWTQPTLEVDTGGAELSLPPPVQDTEGRRKPREAPRVGKVPASSVYAPLTLVQSVLLESLAATSVAKKGTSWMSADRA